MSTDTQHTYLCKLLQDAKATLAREMTESSNINHDQAVFLVCNYERAYKDYLKAVQTKSCRAQRRTEASWAQSFHTIVNFPPIPQITPNTTQNIRVDLTNNIDNAVDQIIANNYERSQS